MKRLTRFYKSSLTYQLLQFYTKYSIHIYLYTLKKCKILTEPDILEISTVNKPRKRGQINEKKTTGKH